MQRDLKGLWRCMGGRFCNHTPGTCTATVGRHAPEPKNQHMSDELVEAVRAAINAVEYAGANVIIDAQLAPGEVDALARASIAVVIERCAKVAEDETWPDRFVTAAQRDGDDRLVHYNDACLDIGAAIRKLGESE